MQTDSDFEECATRLKALADSDRLRIVGSLLCEPKHVSALASELEVGIVKVSHHLAVLRRCRVVQYRKRGKFVIYSLDPEVIAEESNDGIKTLNLGCCRLSLQQDPPAADQP